MKKTFAVLVFCVVASTISAIARAQEIVLKRAVPDGPYAMLSLPDEGDAFPITHVTLVAPCELDKGSSFLLLTTDQFPCERYDASIGKIAKAYQVSGKMTTFSDYTELELFVSVPWRNGKLPVDLRNFRLFGGVQEGTTLVDPFHLRIDRTFAQDPLVTIATERKISLQQDIIELWNTHNPETGELLETTWLCQSYPAHKKDFVLKLETNSPTGSEQTEGWIVAESYDHTNTCTLDTTAMKYWSGGIVPIDDQVGFPVADPVTGLRIRLLVPSTGTVAVP